MTFQYCSDLHLEFPENRHWLTKHPLVPSADVLLLAGDIIPLAQVNKHTDFLHFVADNFEAVYWIPGNHEYYGFNINDKYLSFCEPIRKNVFLTNNKVITMGNVTLILSTLWSHINVVNEWLIQSNLSDFHAISYDEAKLTVRKFNDLHEGSVSFLNEAIINAPGKPSIVLTHHVPTLLNYPKKYINSPISDAFVTEMFSFIEHSNVDYWIYGHHHVNTVDFEIGKTKLVTNQLGYVRYNEQTLFDYSAIFEL